MFLYNTVKLWNNVNELVCFSHVNKFKRSYFEFVSRKFTPDSFEIDRIFKLFNLLQSLVFFFKSCDLYYVISQDHKGDYSLWL